MSLEKRIFNLYAALHSKLDSIPGHPKIVWGNDKEYSPNVGTSYWATLVVPIRTEIASVERMQKQEGVFQVHINVEKNTGLKSLIEDMDKIFDSFNDGEILQYNGTKVYLQGIKPATVQIEDGWCRSYIEIQYMCYSL